MKKLPSFFLVILFLAISFSQIISIPLVIAQEGEVTLSPTDDTFVDNITAVGNHGNADNLRVGKFDHLSLGSVEYLTWLKFNLSSVPEGAVVDVATLQLYSYAVPETYNVYARFCSNNSWTELTLTHANKPGINATSMDSKVIATSYTWYNWTVTDAVQESVNGIFGGPGIVTIVLLETSLHGIGEDLTIFFYSKEGPDLYMPKLTIHWTDVVPEFPSLLILPLLMIAAQLAIIICRRHRWFSKILGS